MVLKILYFSKFLSATNAEGRPQLWRGNQPNQSSDPDPTGPAEKGTSLHSVEWKRSSKTQGICHPGNNKFISCKRDNIHYCKNGSMFDAMWSTFIFLFVQEYFIWLMIYEILTNIYFLMKYFSCKQNSFVFNFKSVRACTLHTLCI